MAERTMHDLYPPDVERDIKCAQNVLGYLQLNETRLLMVLDIIVHRRMAPIRQALTGEADDGVGTQMSEQRPSSGDQQ